MRPVALLTVLLGASPMLAGPAEDYINAQLRVVKGLEAQLPAITRIADEAAARLLAGGQVYLAGQPGMVSELLGRAGGLCAAKAFHTGKTTPGDKDVVLFSDYHNTVVSAPMMTGDALDAWSQLGRSQALVVAFASSEHPFLKGMLPPNGRAVPIGIRHDSRVCRLPSGEWVIPAAAPAIAIAQWTFAAELIGACRRKGKQLAVYLSIRLDEGRKRYNRTQGLLFHPDLKPEPVPEGQFAKAFLGHVRTSLEAMRRNDVGQIRKAAAWIREARAAGKKVVRHMQGHLPPHEVGVLGEPGCFTHSPRLPLGDKAIAWMRENLGKGDVHLLVGYQQNQDAMAAAANALGVRTVFMTSLPPGAEQAKNPLHAYVNPHWPLTDACLELSGYDVKACPLSAICGLTCYYAIGAEVVAGGK